MTLLSAFLKLEHHLVLVVGGGAMAAAKIPALLKAGTRITVSARILSGHLAELVRHRDVTWLLKPFEPSDLNGIFLVIVATNIGELNASVFAEADKGNILCIAVDDIDHGHFSYGSIVQRGDLQIATSTKGKSPAFAQRLRRKLQEQYGPEYAAWLDWLGATCRLLRQLASQPMFELTGGSI